MKVSDDSTNYINIAGDWLYYTTKKGNHRIVKIGTDGSERTILASDQAKYMNNLKCRIYYCNFSDYVKLFTMHADNKDWRLVKMNNCDLNQQLFIMQPDGYDYQLFLLETQKNLRPRSH